MLMWYRSRLYCSGLSAPAEAMIAFEFGCSGLFEMSSFQALSTGKTCMAARILSASGVLNITGLLIGGSVGNSRPLECFASCFCARSWLCDALIEIQRHKAKL